MTHDRTIDAHVSTFVRAPGGVASALGGVALLFGLSVAPTASAQRCEAVERAMVGAVRACARGANDAPVAAGSIAPEVCLRDRLDALYARCPSPFVQLSLGAAEARLHRGVRAWTLLLEALLSRDPLVEANRDDIERNVLPGVRQSVALIAPTCDVAGAVLAVNGRAVGVLPLARPHAVEPGEVTIEVSAPGYERMHRRVALAGGWEYTQAVTLARTPEAHGREAPRGQLQRTAGWALLGTGVALGVAGAVFWGLSYDTTQRLEGFCEQYPGAVDCWLARAQNLDLLGVEVFCANPLNFEAASLCEQYERQAFLGWVWGLGGVVLAATGVALLATSPRSGPPPVRAGAWLQRGGGGVTVGGEF